MLQLTRSAGLLRPGLGLVRNNILRNYTAGFVSSSSTATNSAVAGRLMMFSRQARFSTGRRLLNVGVESTSKGGSTLTWPEFFELRAKRRRVNVVSSMFTAFFAVTIGWAFVSNIEIDPTETIFGFEVPIVMGVCLLGVGTLGYLAGPSMGNVVFKQMNRKGWQTFTKKNYAFLKRIELNRPDASKQSYSNPVNDYYGEKISSLKDYRRWLRDGYAYRKKLEKNFL